MKKLFIILILLLLISLTFSFVYFKISANSGTNNYFNSNLRDSFSRYYLLRQVLGLHYDGDAKSDYLGPKYQEIVIKVISMKGLPINNDILDGLSKKIETVTHKKTNYQYLESNFPFSSISKIKDLDLEFSKKDYSVSNNKAILFLVIANQSETEDQIGSTLRENALVLFNESLLKATRNDVLKENANLYNKYAISTLLHEFGHQIGLEHNDDSDCLMNKNTEFNANPRGSEIIADFCPFELDEIASLISQEK